MQMSDALIHPGQGPVLPTQVIPGAIKLNGTVYLGSIYTKRHTVDGDFVLYDVLSKVECVPDLITYQKAEPGYRPVLQNETVCKILSRYMANLTEDEMEMVLPAIFHIQNTYGITQIIADGHIFKLGFRTVNDTCYLMQVTVMNLA